MGDALYHDTAGRVCVPVGTITVREASAPEGYLAASTTNIVHVSAAGTSEVISTYVAPKVAEQVKRGDLRLVKVREGSMAPRALRRPTSARSGPTRDHLTVPSTATDSTCGASSQDTSRNAHPRRLLAMEVVGDLV